MILCEQLKFFGRVGDSRRNLRAIEESVPIFWICFRISAWLNAKKGLSQQELCQSFFEIILVNSYNTTQTRTEEEKTMIARLQEDLDRMNSSVEGIANFTGEDFKSNTTLEQYVQNLADGTKHVFNEGEEKKVEALLKFYNIVTEPKTTALKVAIAAPIAICATLLAISTAKPFIIASIV